MIPRAISPRATPQAVATAALATGSQSGIITSDKHSDARILEVRPYRVQDELDKGRVVIVAGFQGVSYRREITTLGRGGSDTTAVALAAELQCPVVATNDVRFLDASEFEAHEARVCIREGRTLDDPRRARNGDQVDRMVGRAARSQ